MALLTNAYGSSCPSPNLSIICTKFTPLRRQSESPLSCRRNILLNWRACGIFSRAFSVFCEPKAEDQGCRGEGAYREPSAPLTGQGFMNRRSSLFHLSHWRDYVLLLEFAMTFRTIPGPAGAGIKANPLPLQLPPDPLGPQHNSANLASGCV